MSNPISSRYPFESQIAQLPDEIQDVHRTAWNKMTSLSQGQAALATRIAAVETKTVTTNSPTSSNSSSNSVTPAQATAIANTQASQTIASTFGPVNPQVATAYTTQTNDYGGLITFNNAGATAVTLNSSVASQWFTSMENLGAGTVTITPDTGLINGLASIPLVTGAGAWIYRNPDGTNWSALTVPAPSGGGGVTSLDGITGPVTLVAGTGVTITDNTPAAGDITIAATGTSGVASLQGETGALTLTSSGATVTITTPTSTTINLEAPTASGLPVNNPTFTGTLSGPAAVITEITADHYVGAGSAPSVVGLPLAGTGASFVMDTNATDVAGVIAMIAGAPNSGVGTIATVTYANPYPAGSFVVLTAFTTVTPIPALAQASSVGFDIVFGITISSGTSVAISFIVSGY